MPLIYTDGPSRRAPAVALVLTAALALPGLAAASRHGAWVSPPSHPKRPAHAKRHARAERIAARHRRPRQPLLAHPPASPPPIAAGPDPSASLLPAGKCPDRGLVPANENLARVAAATLCLVNQQRAAAGRAPLRWSTALARAAAGQATDMVSGDYFDHHRAVAPDLLYRLAFAGYPPASTAGENIDAASGPLTTPADAVERWMNQPEHRANILDPTFRDTGVGVVAALPLTFAAGPGAVYTEDFGTTA